MYLIYGGNWLLPFFELCLFLEMLIVLTRGPRAAPGEAVLDEQPVAEVVLVNFVRYFFLSIGILSSFLRLHKEGTVRTATHEGIVEGIDIDGHASRMV